MQIARDSNEIDSISTWGNKANFMKIVVLNLNLEEWVVFWNIKNEEVISQQNEQFRGRKMKSVFIIW